VVRRCCCLNVFGDEKSAEFCALSKKAQAKLKELYKTVPDSVPVIHNGVAGICFCSLDNYKKGFEGGFSKPRAKCALRNLASSLEAFGLTKGIEMVLIFGKKHYGSHLFIPCSVCRREAYVLFELFDKLFWCDKEWQQKPYKKLKV